MMTMTHCQDHMLTENIRVVWSRLSYSADKYGDVADAGRTDERTREDRATQSMDIGDRVS